MKNMIMAVFSLLATLTSRAETRVIQGTARLSVHQLSCVRLAGSRAAGRSYTELPRLTLFDDGKSALELKHPEASVSGCELAKLDAIADASLQTFGFIQVKTEITKDTGEPFMNGSDCLRRYDETLTLHLGQGVALSSRAAEIRKVELKPGQNCQ